MFSVEDGADGWSTTLWKSDTVRFVFGHLNVGNSNSQSKTNAEVTPTDVYNIRSRSVQRDFVPSRTLVDALYILLRVSNLFVLLRRHFLRPKCRNGQQEIPSFFSVCGSEIEHL